MVLYHSAKTACLKKNPFAPFLAHLGPNWAIFGPKISIFQYISNLVHQILMKLSKNVLGIKRMKTNEFGHMFAYFCPGMPII